MSFTLPPDEIKIGTHLFEVLYRDPKEDAGLDDAFGYTIDSSSIIVIRNNMPLAKTQQTLLHEILHGIRFVYGSTTTPSKNANFEDWEHHFISLYEQPLLNLFRDNEALLEYLRDTE